MSWLLFIDESGNDRKFSPYEVLAGVAVRDADLWPLIRQLEDVQVHYFGSARFRDIEDEAKGRKLLKAKTFRLAAQAPPIPNPERRELARLALANGGQPTGPQLAALGQAKIAYCKHVLDICRSHGCVAFASIVPNDLPRPKGEFLRKDYAFLFERFYHFLNQRADSGMGLVVFDELEKTQSHILVGQMAEYFIKTQNGRLRSRKIIPEPLFVHSDLTTMIQIADIVAYVIVWGIRLRFMEKPVRPELGDLARSVLSLRYRHDQPSGKPVWGFKVIQSLDPQF